MSGPQQTARAWWAAIGGLAALALVMRLIGMRESPAGDELFFLSYVDGRSFGSMWDLVVNAEKTPPVGFVLGWLAARLGPADPWMRLPAVLAGAALVPTVALLGRRCVGPACGLVAAALVACSPFLLFYGIESRSYSLAALLSCASVVMLLAAVDRGRKLRWVGWALLTAVALLTHYTSVFVLFASVAWVVATRPDARRALALSCLGVVVSVVWWLPALITQWGNSGDEARRIDALAPLAIDTLARITSRSLIGYPLGSKFNDTSLTGIPGLPGLAMIAVGMAIAIGFAIARRTKGRAREPRPRAETVLLVAMALATPIGLILLSLEPGKSLLLSRNLICSLPAVAVLAALPISRAPVRWAALSAVLVSGGLLFGSVRELHDYNRPNMSAAAGAVSRDWDPGDRILQADYTQGRPLNQDLAIHLGRPAAASLLYASELGLAPFEKAKPGSSLFLVAADSSGFRAEQLGPPPNQLGRWRLIWKRRWPGVIDVWASEWQATGADGGTDRRLR